MSKKTPLQIVKDHYGDKSKLIDKLVDAVDRGDEDKSEFRQRLQTTPNSKLLRLMAVSNEVKSRFGDKDKMVDSLLILMQRSKDKDYRKKLQRHTSVRLLAMHRDWEKKGRRQQAAG